MHGAMPLAKVSTVCHWLRQFNIPTTGILTTGILTTGALRMMRSIALPERSFSIEPDLQRRITIVKMEGKSLSLRFTVQNARPYSYWFEN